MEMEKSWDTDSFLSKHYRAHMQGELCRGLRAYLESWTGFMERTAVTVTRRQDSEGMVHLTCRAFGFFPQNISVVWFRDEEPMNRDILSLGVSSLMGTGPTHLGNHNNSPRRGAAGQVPCGTQRESHYTPRTLGKEPGAPEITMDCEHSCCCSFYHQILSLVILRRGRQCQLQGGEPISLQDRDQFQTEPTDHNGVTHPEFQSSCQTQLLSLTAEA